MAVQPVEWVLVIYYGPSAHRATYGRLGGTMYTKDYIQLKKKTEFLDALRRLFPVTAGAEGAVPLTYKWPTGTTPGTLVFNSADRPHLKWETRLGAPKAWRMSLSPSDAVAETIPGDPTHNDLDAAENELAMLASRGAGQPYLMAIKLHDEPTTLHLRAYLSGPSAAYDWADLGIVPSPVQELAAKASQRSAIAWETFASGGEVPSAEIKNTLSRIESSDTPVAVLDNLDADIGRGLAAYLRRPGYGLFFDPSQNHNAWLQPAPLSERLATSVSVFLETLDAKYLRRHKEMLRRKPLSLISTKSKRFGDRLRVRTMRLLTQAQRSKRAGALRGHLLMQSNPITNTDVQLPELRPETFLLRRTSFRGVKTKVFG